eukprot:TRINITY_DN75269_c0_g1_i1.p4 TRINITY_DN75269_c0_g1~~TRINITY_DN75269_c0_g1_i1.p4  ORF type:complete len:150 (-),score=38.29 TRINITY_DN75269_c0_g1_i1:167-616(-)
MNWMLWNRKYCSSNERLRQDKMRCLLKKKREKRKKNNKKRKQSDKNKKNWNFSKTKNAAQGNRQGEQVNNIAAHVLNLHLPNWNGTPVDGVNFGVHQAQVQTTVMKKIHNLRITNCITSSQSQEEEGEDRTVPKMQSFVMPLGLVMEVV